jgi:RNA polymerase sigma-70 factor (ECF subfamily)
MLLRQSGSEAAPEGDVTIDNHHAFSEGFESVRPHLRAVAYRMLGSYQDADDAVQEAWLRLERSGPEGIENLEAWLTTIVARVCLDRLRSVRTRREEPAGMRPGGDERHAGEDPDPEEQLVLADAIGSALVVLLARLRPAERVAFVLHDIFAISFAEIGTVVKRSPDATRQLASRARRRLQGGPTGAAVELTGQREVIDAFLTASRLGDFTALLGVLDPDVIFRADDAALRLGAPREADGAAAVARATVGRTSGAVLGTVDRAAGLIAAPRGVLLAAFAFAITDGRIAAINMIADSEHLASMELEVCDAGLGC